jgi:hypothetical protein
MQYIFTFLLCFALSSVAFAEEPIKKEPERKESEPIRIKIGQTIPLLENVEIYIGQSVAIDRSDDSIAHFQIKIIF